MDPYYSTLEGLCALIEKDWCGFGHKFHDRIGHGRSTYAKEAEEISPVFLQVACLPACLPAAPKVCFDTCFACLNVFALVRKYVEAVADFGTCRSLQCATADLYFLEY